MIKIPFLNRFITDDQEFYDAQINEELKYCDSSNFMIRFTDVCENKRAFVIKTKEKQIIALIFMKSDYKGINEALEKIRLNLALAKKENLLKSPKDDNATLEISAKNQATIGENTKGEDPVTISTVEQLLINNTPLKGKEDTIKRLLDLATQNNRKEPYLDFFEAGYDKGLQDYLIMHLYKESIALNDNLVNAITYYKEKEPKFYYLVNSLLRGNFDEMFNYLNSMKRPISVTAIARIAQNIIQAQEELPNRSHDLMIYRAGLGINKNKTVGGQNSYESFVSFGTSGGILVEPASSDSSPIVYKRILKKDDKAIPVDVIENIGIVYIDGTQENEFLLPPFTFEITDIYQEEGTDIYCIEETGKINPRELLDRRLDELEQYLKSKNDVEQYERLRQARGKITKKAKKVIAGYNIKDVYYGLRPKRRRTKQMKDNSIER